MALFPRANDALLHNGNTVNGATADIALTTHGSDWYWVRPEKKSFINSMLTESRLYAQS